MKQLSMRLLLPEEKLHALGRFQTGGENRVALEAARAFGKRSPTAFVVVGQAKSGKTHLLKGIALAWKDAAFLDGPELAALDEAGLAALFERAAEYPLVCIDDLDGAKEPGGLHEAVFNLFNTLAAEGKHLAVTLKTSPAKAPLPDYLSSRLLTGMVVTLKRPDDEERKRILLKIAQDRAISLTPRAIDYILARAGRSVGDLLALVERIEPALPPRGGRIGLQLLKRVIDSKAS